MRPGASDAFQVLKSVQVEIEAQIAGHDRRRRRGIIPNVLGQITELQELYRVRLRERFFLLVHCVKHLSNLHIFHVKVDI